jgi:hypothetical protein
MQVVTESSHTAKWVSHGLHPVWADGPQGVAALLGHDVDGQFRLRRFALKVRLFDLHDETFPLSVSAGSEGGADFG